MSKNLQNTILLENEEYNINAVYSEEAGKVINPLTVKESGVEVLDFDGSITGTIDYVPADRGGTFKGPVYRENPAQVPADN